MTDRKRTPGSFRAVGPEADTDPAPPEELAAKLQEVVEALANLGELGADLKRMLSATRLAQLASEGRLNVHSAKIIGTRRWLADHESRLRDAERFIAGLKAEGAEP